ncbi:MAG TPA: hypothetical protein VI233_06120 [Puia sp.]
MLFHKTTTQLKALPDFSTFQFTSKGIAGNTLREISFRSQEEPGIYNLDINDGSAEGQPGSAIADNGDISKVLNTLVLVIELYTQRFPDRTIRLRGNTQEKARLYRVAIDMYVNKLLPVFDIGLEEEPPRGLGLRTRRGRDIDNIAITLKRKPGFSFVFHCIQATINSRSLLFGNLVSVELQDEIEMGLATADSDS